MTTRTESTIPKNRYEKVIKYHLFRILFFPPAGLYPAGFFDTVYDMFDNSVKVITYGDCVFAVRKENLEKLGEGLYAGYRSSLIKDMYGEEWQKTIDSYIETFTVDEKNI